MEDFDWIEYIKKTDSIKPRQIIIEALKLFPPNFKGKAIDIGCGAGNEVCFLLENGWKVIAIDNLSYVVNNINSKLKNCINLEFQIVPFEKIKWECVDLIHSSLAIPFCNKSYVETLLKNILLNVKTGGLISISTFGNREDREDLVLLSKDKLKSYFDKCEILYFDEQEKDILYNQNKTYHMHRLSLIAKKKL